MENVPNMLVLHKGAAMRFIVDSLEAQGYRWAYRTLDARFTGVPQRRLRVIVLATNSNDVLPEDVLLSQDRGEPPDASFHGDAYGFYWTEGRGGIGWARDAIPTLKGGSTIGVPSGPAVWLPGNERGNKLLMPSVEAGEALQGFPRGWTAPAVVPGQPDHRWKLIGNAVPPGLAQWLGERLRDPRPFVAKEARRFDGLKGWPSTGWGTDGQAFTAPISAWPRRLRYTHLKEVIELDQSEPMSWRAANGFLRRLDESKLRIDPIFLRDVEEHVRATRPALHRPRHGRRPAAVGEALPPGSWASSPEARRRMQANRGRDTKPELVLRRELFGLGLRYRLHCRPEPLIRNRLDIVFRGAKVAVDVRGCFWHACSLHGTAPKANALRWREKLERNVARDRQLESDLVALGWQVVVVWEHDDPVVAAKEVAALVKSGPPIRDRAQSRP